MPLQPFVARHPSMKGVHPSSLSIVMMSPLHVSQTYWFNCPLSVVIWLPLK